MTATGKRAKATRPKSATRKATATAAKATKASRRAGVEIHPVTPERLADLEQLFGKNGACAGCWCMYFKQSGPEFQASRGEKNRALLRRSVKGGSVPGLLAYCDGEPAGWCAVEPREKYARIVKSRILKPLDGRTAWSTPCFFVAREQRGRGLTTALLEAAAEHARAGGAEVLEGYPIVTRGRIADAWAYHGLVPCFERAGFQEAAAPSPSRRVMRRELASSSNRKRKRSRR